MIEVIDIEEGDIISSTGRKTQVIRKAIDEDLGILHLAMISLGSQSDGANGSGILATIRFRTANIEDVDFRFVHTQLVRPDAAYYHSTVIKLKPSEWHHL